MGNLSEGKAREAQAPDEKSESAGIAGVICGRAIYDGAIDLKAALAILES